MPREPEVSGAMGLAHWSCDLGHLPPRCLLGDGRQLPPRPAPRRPPAFSPAGLSSPGGRSRGGYSGFASSRLFPGRAEPFRPSDPDASAGPSPEAERVQRATPPPPAAPPFAEPGGRKCRSARAPAKRSPPGAANPGRNLRSGGRRNDGRPGRAVLRCPLAAAKPGQPRRWDGRPRGLPWDQGRSLPNNGRPGDAAGSARPALLAAEGPPGEQQQQRRPVMTAAQKCSFFPQEPYYVPGYGGFYPQVRYHVGQSYGRTTSRMLTDPGVRKSPCSVLTPLKRPKFTEDFSQQKLPAPDRMDQGQFYVPGYTGFVPYTGCFPIPSQDFQLPLPRALPLPDPPLWTEGHPASAQRKGIPCHPGIRLACGPGWRQFAATAGSQLVSPKDEQRFLCHPDIALVCGQEEGRGPCKAGMSLVCGQGWRGPPCRPGTDQPTRIEGVPLPLATETVNVRRFDRIPRLDLPNLIQRKAISGYAGFIPCFTWIMGVNYLKGVKDAMDNFDRNQERLRNPIYSFGQRLPHTYWPNTKIYNSRGLVPFYSGFVPTIREHYALTFGNSTRKAFYDEVQQRQHTG